LKITPLELKQQEFKRVMRGYDPVEVDTFLDMVGTEFEKILNNAKEYEKNLSPWKQNSVILKRSKVCLSKL